MRKATPQGRHRMGCARVLLRLTNKTRDQRDLRTGQIRLTGPLSVASCWSDAVHHDATTMARVRRGRRYGLGDVRRRRAHDEEPREQRIRWRGRRRYAVLDARRERIEPFAVDGMAVRGQVARPVPMGGDILDLGAGATIEQQEILRLACCGGYTSGSSELCANTESGAEEHEGHSEADQSRPDAVRRAAQHSGIEQRMQDAAFQPGRDVYVWEPGEPLGESVERLGFIIIHR